MKEMDKRCGGESPVRSGTKVMALLAAASSKSEDDGSRKENCRSASDGAGEGNLQPCYWQARVWCDGEAGEER